MKSIKIAGVSLFFLLLILPIIFMNFKSDTISEVDNRRLQEFPLGENYGGNFTGELTDYFSDRAAGRDFAIELYTNAYDSVFGELKHPSFSYGKDDYVFFKPTNYVDQSEFAEVFASFLKKLQDYCQDRGVPFLYCLNPSKSTVYEEFLPYGFNNNRDWVEYFVECLQGMGVNYIDNTDMLIEKHYSEQVYNKQFDAGHWNDLGAYYGSNAILAEVSKDFPSVRANTLEDFNILEATAEYLTTSKFKINDIYPDFQLKNDYSQWITTYNDEIYMNSMYPDFNHFINHSDEVDTLPSVLMFQGSYFNSRTKYMSNRFREYITVHNYYNVASFEYYFNLFQPEYVIVTTAEYTTNGAYFSQEYLQDKVMAPNFDTFLDFEEVVSGSNLNLNYKNGSAIWNGFVQFDLDKTDYAYISVGDKVYDMFYENYSGWASIALKNEIAENEEIKLIGINLENKEKIVYNTILIEE